VFAFLIANCFIFGLVIGSFLNVVIHRVPNGESIVTPRSRCPKCGTELSNVDNIPVVSWLVLRGKCRTCAAPISRRYPLVEAGTGVAFALMGARVGADWALPAFLVWTAGLIALSAIDLDTYRLPNAVVYPTGVATFVLLAVASVVSHDARGLVEAAAGGSIAFAVLFVIHVISPKGMGFGDVRLAAVLGLALGWIELPLVAVGLFFSFLLASIVGVLLIATGARSRKDRIPFGPFLALGSFLAVLVGDGVLDLYLRR
jgi:leader peptidase (prepilin peptidase)/N-methyltransferase